MAVVEEVKLLKQELKKFARVKHELSQERQKREEMKQMWHLLHQRQYQAMRDLKLHIDDKVEEVVDKSQDIADSVKTLHSKVISVEDSNFELENRVEKLELMRGWQSRSLTPVVENSLERSVEKAMALDPPIQAPLLLTQQLPIRVEKRQPQVWTVRVMFLPSRLQKHAFEYDTAGMKRCKSRNLIQEITFTGSDSNTFNGMIEAHFKHVLRGRPWVPLSGYRPEDEPYGHIVLKQLPVHLHAKENWDFAFLERECIVHDKLQGETLYLALENENLSWADIRWLPGIPGSDETCWAHDDELDGTKSTGFKSLDSELMYEMEPPPYTSRTHIDTDRLPSRLDLLAHASSMQSFADSPRPSTSVRSSTFSEVRSISDKSFSDLSFHSDRTVSTMELSDDEHMDKKLRMKHSVPSFGSSSAGPSNHSIYVSGRSKRKMPNKMKEPVHWNVDSLTRPLHAIRKNRNATKDKVEPAQP